MKLFPPKIGGTENHALACFRKYWPVFDPWWPLSFKMRVLINSWKSIFRQNKNILSNQLQRKVAGNILLLKHRGNSVQTSIQNFYLNFQNFHTPKVLLTCQYSETEHRVACWNYDFWSIPPGSRSWCACPNAPRDRFGTRQEWCTPALSEPGSFVTISPSWNSVENCAENISMCASKLSYWVHFYWFWE